MQTLPKTVPESMFWLTDFAVRTLVGFRKPLVKCESGFRKLFIQPLAGFSKPDMTVNIPSASPATYRKSFYIHNRLTEAGISSLYRVSVGST
jgi:hypothetical protein